MIIRRIGVLSCAKIVGAIYAALGLIVGAVFALMAVLGPTLAAEAFDSMMGGAALGFLFGIGGLIIMPVLYGVMGFIGGAISALVYNVVAGSIGGLELVLAERAGGQPAH
jgi:hypothetical protein